jgi:hypothetical protein
MIQIIEVVPQKRQDNQYHILLKSKNGAVLYRTDEAVQRHHVAKRVADLQTRYPGVKVKWDEGLPWETAKQTTKPKRGATLPPKRGKK